MWRVCHCLPASYPSEASRVSQRLLAIVNPSMRLVSLRQPYNRHACFGTTGGRLINDMSHMLRVAPVGNSDWGTRTSSAKEFEQFA
eukprot:6605761-Pyramimonas_sp.AAC.1